MYKTVLWASDASPLAEAALAEALEILAPDGRLIVFHCDERFGAGRAGGVPVLADEPERIARLRGLVADLQERDLDAELIVKTTHRSAATEIAHAAEANDVDAIVCGSRGLGAVAGTVTGSVALRLPHLAPCPVLVVSDAAVERRLVGSPGLR